jgi:hypothetical protein
MFIRSLFDVLDVLLMAFVGKFFAVLEISTRKINVKIGRGGGAR